MGFGGTAAKAWPWHMEQGRDPDIFGDLGQEVGGGGLGQGWILLLCVKLELEKQSFVSTVSTMTLVLTLGWNDLGNAGDKGI